MTTTMARRPSARPTWRDKPASDKAAGFWASLRHTEIDLSIDLEIAITGTTDADRAALHAEVTAPTTAGEVSDGIDSMKASIDALRRTLREAARQADAAKAAEAVAAGGAAEDVVLVADRLYLVDGRVYRTVQSRSSDGMYAKVLDTDTGGWEYAPGAIRRITPAHRMTVEQAEEMSIHFARCIRCWRELEVKESVARGIGPKCAKKV